MATSGSWDFSLTASQLIDRVAKNLGILAAGGTINSNDQTDILQTLNVVAKELQGTSDFSQGTKEWTRQRIALFLAKGQQTYTIGPASADSRASTTYGITTISAFEAAAQTVISITSNTDTTTAPGTTVTMTNGDIVGIELNDGTVQWTTISGTPASTMTISVALTAAANAGNYVYWFTSRAQRFPVVESVVLRNENRNDRELNIYRTARAYELGVADKYADGSPSSVLIEPLRLNTRVTLDTQPTDVSEYLILTVLYPSEDYDAVANDIAFPQEWFGLLEWETTLRCCPMYGKVWNATMERNYRISEMRAQSLNPEMSDAYFRCNA